MCCVCRPCVHCASNPVNVRLERGNEYAVVNLLTLNFLNCIMEDAAQIRKELEVGSFLFSFVFELKQKKKNDILGL